MKLKSTAAIPAICLLLFWPGLSAGRQPATGGTALPPGTADTPMHATNASPASIPSGQSVRPPTAEVSNLAMVESVSIQADRGQAIIKIRTTRQVSFQPFHLTNPARLVIDLDQTEMAHFRKVVAKQAGALEDVRVAQFRALPSPVTRVVADLSGPAPFHIQSEPDGVQIRFENPVQPHAAAESATLAHSTRSHDPGIEQIAAVQTPGYSAASASAVDLSRPVRLDFGDLEPAFPAKTIASPAAQNPAMVKDAPRAKARTLAFADPLDPPSQPRVDPPQMETSYAASTTPMQPAPQTTGLQGAIMSTPFFSTATPHYTGKLISLDLRDVDIRDFFRLIHRVSGLNLAVDPDVTGRITLVMDDVPWDQALDIVLKNNDLGKTIEDGVVRIAKSGTLVNEASTQAKTRIDRLKAEPLVTVIRRLKYAHAADQLPGQAGAVGGPGGAPQIIPGVASLLNGLKGSIVSADGRVLVDPLDNALIITDHLSQIPIIDKVIDRLDVPSKQLSIQVRVVLANSDFTRTLSSVLSAAFNNQSGRTHTAAGTGQGISGVAPTSSPLPLLTIPTQAPTVSATGFGAFAIANAGAQYAINAAITAAETRDQARTLSRPTIVTQDNVKGEVQQG
ncbi:MAG: AMIN domain-containing protein, partial [Terriglobia bacterium]